MEKQRRWLMTEPAKTRIVYGPCATVLAAAHTGAQRTERPQVDPEKCVQCRTCERFCPTACISMNPDKAVKLDFDFYYCKGCGICANECPVHALTMVPEEEK